MINDALVTVVIPSYNHGPYVEQSICSVLAQTYPHVELLVVDDGSSDDSVEKIRRLQVQYGFDFVTQTNKGLTTTLNESFARAKGSFLVPFGSDDVMLPERLARQISYLSDKPEVGICGGNIELMRADGSLLPESEQRRDIPFRRLDFDDIFLERKPCLPAPTMVIRREALECVGGFDPAIRLEDLYIQLKITKAGYYADALGEVLARYRKHPSNNFRNLRFMTEAVLQIYSEYADHPEYETVKHRFINSMFVKASKRDRRLAGELLSQLPLHAWNRRTLRGLLRYRWAPLVRA